MDNSTINFYYVEKPKGHNEYMLFTRYENMPQKAYHGSKKLMNDIHKGLNKILNRKYNEQGRPTLFIKDNIPKLD